jgi:UDP-N-acetyl-D-mannosaminuronic acid transferase (WecB/TagA/CpsF family)
LELPFFKNTKNIKNFKIDIENNSVVIINISTPKQEIVAKNILHRNQDEKIFIFCMRAAIAMHSGEEKIVPFIIQEKNLEWL